jgi:transcriptional regulator with XRE-family HTH domain
MKAKDLNDHIENQFGDPAAFCRDLKAALFAGGITITALAAEAGYDVGNTNRWVNGRKEPSLRVMLALNEALERLLEDV